jgi:hypothetical protein
VGEREEKREKRVWGVYSARRGDLGWLIWRLVVKRSVFWGLEIEIEIGAEGGRRSSGLLYSDSCPCPCCNRWEETWLWLGSVDLVGVEE